MTAVADKTITLTAEDAHELSRTSDVGDVLLGWLAATVQLGHDSPGMSLEYMHFEEGTTQAFVADFIAWTSGRKKKRPGCEERMREFGLTEARHRLAVNA